MDKRKFFNLECVRHRLDVLSYHHSKNVRKMRCLDNLYLIDFIEQLFKGKYNSAAALEALQQSALMECMKKYPLILPGDWPTKFHVRQDVYSSLKDSTFVTHRGQTKEEGSAIFDAQQSFLHNYTASNCMDCPELQHSVCLLHQFKQSHLRLTPACVSKCSWRFDDKLSWLFLRILSFIIMVVSAIHLKLERLAGMLSIVFFYCVANSSNFDHLNHDFIHMSPSLLFSSLLLAVVMA